MLKRSDDVREESAPKRQAVDLRALLVTDSAAKLFKALTVVTPAVKEPQTLKYPSLLNDSNKDIFSLPYARKIAHCSKTFDELYIYQRVEMQTAVGALLIKGEKFVTIEGPPGCGKSTAAWYVALSFAKSGGSAIWLDIGRNEYVHLHDELIEPVRLFELTPFKENVKEVGALFVDGATAKNEELLRIVFSHVKFENTSVRVVSPLQMSSKLLKMFGFWRERVRGWTLAEYHQACEDPEFFLRVLPNLLTKSEEILLAPAPTPGGAGTTVFNAYTAEQRGDLVRRKYGLAGHSARWMWDMDFADVQADITANIEAISDIQAMFNMSPGEKAASIRNTLIQRDPNGDPKVDDNLVFTSGFVARAIAAKNPGWLPELHQLASRVGNAAMQSHAVEADFLYAARHGRLTNRVRYVQGPGDALPQVLEEEETCGGDEMVELHPAPTGRVVNERPDNTYSPTLQNTWVSFYYDVLDPRRPNVARVHNAGTWMIPEVPNQGGFDAAQLCIPDGSAPYLRFVEITVQLNHSIKVDFMRTFLASLNTIRAEAGLPDINHIEIVVILPDDIAVWHTAPSSWKLRGVPRTDNLNITASVAGFALTPHPGP
jgi:hypothetical protein